MHQEFKYKTATDQRNSRVVSISIQEEAFINFSANFEDKDIGTLLAVPAERFRIAHTLRENFTPEMIKEIMTALSDREKGAISLKMPDSYSREMVEAFTIGLGYLVGNPRPDHNNSPIASLEGYDGHDFLNVDTKRTLPLHTDGTYYEGKTDWIILSLIKDGAKKGGESMLLHIDEWLSNGEISLKDKFAKHSFHFEGPSKADSRKSILGSRGDTGHMERPMFYDHPEFGKSLRIAHQWVHPKNFEEAAFITKIIDSLAAQEEKAAFPLQQNELYLINNHLWLHGRRKSFDEAPVNRIAVRCFGELRR